MTEYSEFRLAAIQEAPVYFDREASTQKACELIRKAGAPRWVPPWGWLAIQKNTVLSDIAENAVSFSYYPETCPFWLSGRTKKSQTPFSVS